MTDQELADRVHNATRVLNEVWVDALEAGPEVSVASFLPNTPGLRAFVGRRIPAVITDYPPTVPYP